MLKRLSLTAAAIVACLTPLADPSARAQTVRQEGRMEARAARQTGRANARTFGDFGNRGYYYYGPGGYYGSVYGPGYAGGYYAGYRGGPGYYGGYGGGYYGGGYYGGPGYSGFAGQRFGGTYAQGAYNGGSYQGGRSYGPQVAGRAYLGITMSETPDGMVRVSGVRPNSPADEAGVRPGDILIAIDGRDIYTSQDVTRTVARHVPGEAVRLDIDRNGRTDELEAVLAPPSGQFVGRAPRANYQSEYPADRSQYPPYVEPYETLPAPTQARRVPNTYINVY